MSSRQRVGPLKGRRGVKVGDGSLRLRAVPAGRGVRGGGGVWE